MTRFAYSALSPAGDREQGRLEAPSQSAALEQLRVRNLVALEVRPAGGLWDRLDEIQIGAPRRRLSARERINLTEELSVLLTAGMTLDEALKVLQTTARSKSARALLGELITGIRSGLTLDEALSAHPREFSADYLTMVRAGENAGSLPTTLKRLHAYMSRAERLRERFRAALIYPAILTIMIVLTLIMVVTVVLPRFEQLFSDAGARLPFATRAVLALGRAAGTWGPVVAALTSVALAITLVLLRSPARRLAFDGWILRAPGMFGLQRTLPAARFLRALSTLLNSGTPVVQALQIASGVLRNRALRAMVQLVQQRVQAGQPLSRELRRTGAFPEAAVQLAHIGEHSGQLGELLEHAADALDRDAERTLERLFSVVVPGATVLMGLLVASLIASVLVGVLSINDLAL